MTMELFIQSLFIILFTFHISVAQDVIYHIEEEQPSNTTVGNVANDSNLNSVMSEDDFNSLRYSFLTSNPGVSLFRLDERSSSLYTSEKLDREKLCEFLTICVFKLKVAVQAVLGSFFRIIEVKIFIEDINDHSPVFPRDTINLPISESVFVGTSFTIDGARDRDTSRKYSLQKYDIFPKNSPFSIKFVKNLDGSSIVRLFINQPLNREVKKSYEIQVVAEDGDTPPEIGTLHVNITITDSNDNPPHFTDSEYRVTVNEGLDVNTVILRVLATDLDDGNNGKIVYHLSSHQSDTIHQMFAVNESTGEILVIGNLVYNPDPYQIIVQASDMGEQPMTSQTIVTVKVLDTGNNPPTININLLTGSNVAKTSEYANINATVSHIAIIDADTGQNGIVNCSIISSHFGLQKMDVNEYKIVVARSLDREKKQKHDVRVYCVDKGIPPLQTTENFIVEVTDENDNNPYFYSPKYSAHLYENTRIGHNIIQVLANDVDLDENANITYSLAPEANSNFTIDPVTGNISTAKVFDREKVQKVSFTVYAVDSITNPLTGSATVEVTILDQNDMKPEFKYFRYILNVAEGLTEGALVDTVTATDNDTGINAQISYSMEWPRHSDMPFTIHSNGDITANRELDREYQNRYDFTLVATDMGEPKLSGSTHITVFVLDKNDNPPEVSFPKDTNRTVFVPYMTLPGITVSSIKAFDPDENENGKLTYTVVYRNDSGNFYIDKNNGNVIVQRALSKNLLGKIYKFDLVISDNGSSIQSVQTTLYVAVTQMNVTGLDHRDSDTVQNFIIVITIAAVTFVLSALIIATICFLRRIDQQKRKHNDSLCCKPKMLDNGVTIFALPNSDSELTVGEKKKKKEVSFSFDEEDCMSEHHPFHPSLHITNEEIGQVFQPPLTKDVTKRQEDNHSETSGETNTSDSGRGGSEDEANTSRASASAYSRTERTTSPGPSYQYEPSGSGSLQTFSTSMPRAVLQQKIIPFSFKQSSSSCSSSSGSTDSVRTDQHGNDKITPRRDSGSISPVQNEGEINDDHKIHISKDIVV
ncbi:hypothetical protein ScPMuIL_010463 [Solemya velum]